jgi:hypothetical protein
MNVSQDTIKTPTCAPMFTAALLTIVPKPRCPTTDEWFKKMWYLYTMDFYSAIRNNDMWLKVNECNWKTS